MWQGGSVTSLYALSLLPVSLIYLLGNEGVAYSSFWSQPALFLQPARGRCCRASLSAFFFLGTKRTQLLTTNTVIPRPLNLWPGLKMPIWIPNLLTLKSIVWNCKAVKFGRNVLCCIKGGICKLLKPYLFDILKIHRQALKIQDSCMLHYTIGSWLYGVEWNKSKKQRSQHLSQK